MLFKNETFSGSPHAFFPLHNSQSAWKIIGSGLDYSLFLNVSSKILLGLGANPFFKDPYYYGEKKYKPWSIPLRSELLINQAAAGDRHVSKDFALLKNPEVPCASPEDPLFRKVNAAFYLAGVLSLCLKNKELKPVKETLFELQFVKSQLNYKPDWDRPKKCLEIYEEGLAVLQKYNSALRLITKESYLEFQKTTEYYESDLAAVYKAQANEYEDNECRIM